MATTKTDRFHDDLIDLLRKYDVELDRRGNPGLYLAYEDLLTEVEKVHEAGEGVKTCDHCSGSFTALHFVRGENLAVCAQCRDGITKDIAEAADPENGPDAAAFDRWANKGMR